MAPEQLTETLIDLLTEHALRCWFRSDEIGLDVVHRALAGDDGAAEAVFATLIDLADDRGIDLESAAAGVAELGAGLPPPPSVVLAIMAMEAVGDLEISDHD